MDFKALVPEDIKAEDDAFSILLGLEPEHFKRFCDLSARKGQPADKRGYTPYIHFEADDKWFFSSYREFLEQAFSRIFVCLPFLVSFKSTYFNQITKEGFVDSHTKIIGIFYKKRLVVFPLQKLIVFFETVS